MTIKKLEELVIQKAMLPTDYGDFELIALGKSEEDQMPHIVLRSKGMDYSKPVLLRIHSECITGDLFHSKRCDCGEQLDQALKLIAQEKGLLIYLRQEGRGIGILNKLQAYNLQDEGMDTIEANIHLGFEADERDYELAVEILTQLGIEQIRLLTNNPEKISAFSNTDIEIIDRVPLKVKANEINSDYLETKRNDLGHLL